MTMRNDATRTRIPINEKRRPRAVVARQGQVLLDTDFDQQVRHQLERLEIETVDSLGSPDRLLVPSGNTGFQVTAAPSPGHVSIAPGRGYLRGWLLENAAACTLATQPHPRTPADSPAVPVVITIKALIRHLDPVEEPKLADAALGDAQASGRALNDWQVFPLNLSGSVTCATVLTNPTWQALAAPSTGTLTVLEQAAAPSTDPCSLTPGGGYTRLENLLYRVEVHDGAANAAFPTIDGPRFTLHNLKIKFSRRNASVMVRIKTITNAEFKVEPPVLDPRNWFAPGQFAEIVSIHDDVDPRRAVGQQRMFRVAKADDDVVVLEDTTSQIPAIGATGDGTWFLRLWDAFPDGTGIATVSAPGSATESAEIDLGDGLKLKLGTGGSTGTFRRGDYWNCAARADGTTDWPKTGSTANPMTPHGPEVRYAPVAVLTGSLPSPTIEDCRIPFATLSDRVLLYRGGDGQSLFTTATAGMQALPAKARVAVMRGETPVNGATVRWSFVAPSGSSCLIDGAPCTTFVDKATVANGLSEVTWSIDASKPLDLHRIRAALVLAGGTTSEAIEFSAVFETASHTSYTPGKCDHLVGVNNVQTALDILCSKIPDPPQALTLTSIVLLDQKGGPFELVQKELILNAQEVRYNSFAGGIAFGFDGGTPEVKLREYDPIVEVELDLPYPVTDFDRLYWVQASDRAVAASVGFMRMRLDGFVEITKGPDGKPVLMWRPTKDAVQFLESAPRHLFGQRIVSQYAATLKESGWAFKSPLLRTLCRIRLRSALIWAKGKGGPLYLNAEHLGVSAGLTDRELMLKERDPQRAADLDMFVYLLNEAPKMEGKIPTDTILTPGGIVIPGGGVKPGGGIIPIGRSANGAPVLAPYYPTPQPLVARMLEFGELQQGEQMFDLGSGDGRIVITAASQFDAVATGVEADDRLWTESTNSIRRLGLENKARTILGDATAQDLSAADLVTIYLGTAGNETLRPMLEQQLRPGARVVSHDYEIPGWQPVKTERYEDENGRTHLLFGYTR